MRNYRISVLQLYRGPRMEFVYHRHNGSPLSVSLTLDQKVVMRANPSDFIALQSWLAAQAQALKDFMHEPEDPTVAENLRGDQGDTT